MLVDPFIEAIKPHVDFTKVKTILDIGSRDLEQSLELHSVFPNAHIHAFEPNPESFKDCQAKAPDYITVWPYAALDSDGEITFYNVPQDENKGASSIFEPTEHVVGVDMLTIQKITVPTKRIDTWATENNISTIDLCWIDVQGAEMPVFKGFGTYLHDVQAIATEAETGALYYGNRKYEPTQYTELKEFLEHEGFTQIAYDQPWALEADIVFVRTK
jgi:FkbM family methyltransferase